MTRRIACLLLALVLGLGATAAAADYDVVGAFSQYPLAGEGENVTLTVSVPMNDSYAVSYQDTWFWQWWTAASGVKFEVEQILSSGLDQRKSLMFASDSLPDILMGMALTSDEIMRYGAGEKMLLSFNSYFNDDVMPNLNLLLETYPISRANITAADGEAYSLPFYVNQLNLHGESARLFIDQNRLDAAGVGVPQTLDELVSTLYAFKEADPDCIPLGGSSKAYDPTHYLLNALGFLGAGGNDGTYVTVRNGEAVIPAGDELYKVYLEIMKDFYDDGIISEDFFTADATTVNAQMSEGLLGLYPFVPFTVTPEYEDYSHWVSITPMTSQYSDTKQWLAYNTFGMGGFAASADTADPELICRLADFFYSDFGYLYIWEGPWYGTSDTMGLVQGRYTWYDHDDLNEFGEAKGKINIPEVDEGIYENNYDYKYHQTAAVFAFGNNGIAVGLSRQMGFDVGFYETSRQLGLGFKTQDDYDYYMSIWHNAYERPYSPDRKTNEGQFRGSMYDNVSPYETTGFPAITYFTEDESLAMNDLSTIIRPYIRSETAKFITGARSLEEFDEYLKELEDLGFSEWEQYYKDMWAAYQANLG